MPETQNVSGENSLGLSSHDPNAKDDLVIEGADLHLQLNKPVKLLMRSVDVIHDFYVPEFRAKMDIVPGMVTYVWFTPTRTGTFEVFCAELCGTGHYYYAQQGRSSTTRPTIRPGSASRRHSKAIQCGSRAHPRPRASGENAWGPKA